MSIPVTITPESYRKIKRELLKQAEVVCLDETSYLATLLVGRDLLMKTMKPVAKVIKGY
jgi:hypothetical protein